LSNKKIFRTGDGDHLNLQDDEFLICEHLIPGFSLVDKAWGFFNVDYIHEIEYNSVAFEALMLDPEQEQMILSLVKIHTDPRLSFDDIITGKGKGMVFLLHGEPGVGKTLTAGMLPQRRVVLHWLTDTLESVADFCKRPLYILGAGDLGSTPLSVEKALGDALRLATTWNAIILIDEADIFLEQRTSQDITRNRLVSGKTNPMTSRSVMSQIIVLFQYSYGYLSTTRASCFSPRIASAPLTKLLNPASTLQSSTLPYHTLLDKIYGGHSSPVQLPKMTCTGLTWSPSVD
jgi:hypothetical protein